MRHSFPTLEAAPGVSRRRADTRALADLRPYAVAAVVVAAAIVGAGIGVETFTASSVPQHLHGTAAPDIGRVNKTSFGVVSVDRATRLEGSGARQLIRLSGGGEKVALQVAITVTNLRARPLPLHRTDLKLRTASGELIEPLLASVWPGRVAPFAAKKVLYRFAVPDEPIWAEYFDPRGSPIVAAIGRPRDLRLTIALTAHAGH